MNILTLNLWGNYGPYRERWEFFLEELDSLNPDLICLQEIKDDLLTQKIKKTFGIEYVLTDYESGLAILSRFPFSKKETLQYKSSSPIESELRKALITNIILPTGQGEITIVNTHLSWKAEDEPTRLGQVNELLESLKKLGGAILLAGDFNDTPESKPIKEIKNAGYFDSLELLHPGEPNITWDNRNPFIQTHSVKFQDRRIDFLFLNQELLEIHPPKTCEVVFNCPNVKGIYPSDHYGIFARI